MGTFEDFDLEIQDERDSNPEHINGAVAVAGTPDTITPTSGKAIQAALIQCPSKGPNANASPNDVLLINIDGTAVDLTVARGESVVLKGVFTSISIDTNNSGTKYEIVVWS